jgi:Zn-dependent protease with chaperone function
MYGTSLLRRTRSLLLVAILSLGGCATKNIVQAPTGRFQLQPGYNAFSADQEIQLGQQAAQEVAQQMPLLPENDPITKYVQQLGQTLAAQAPGDVKWPFSFHVVNQKEINAFALPGGPVFVNLGTIQAADDEGQLAGVMAHEISHVVLRHGTQQASKQQMAQIPLAILGGVLPQGVGGQLARLGLSFGAQSIFLKYSRDAEREADLLGSQIMYDAGYDPYSMVEFFTKLEKEGGAGAPQFLSDHPNPGNRVESVRQAIEKYPRKSYRRNSPQFERIKTDAQKRQPLTAQQIAERQQRSAQVQGFDPRSVLPSDRFQSLDHNAFQIGYPSNWRVYGDANSPVTIAPQACVAQNAIACGVIISGFRGSDPRESLEQATSELVQSMQQANPQLQISRQPQGLQVSGTPAIAVDMVSPSPIASQGGPVAERDMLVTVPRGDGTFMYLIFIAPQQDFQQFSGAYSEMLRSMRMR